MTVERYLRLIAGVAVLTSVTLAVFVNHWWLAFTAFVGVNLFQSAFSDWCPVKTVLERRLGIACCTKRTDN